MNGDNGTSCNCNGNCDCKKSLEKDLKRFKNVFNVKKFEPFVNTKADYNTNAKSYYDFIARFSAVFGELENALNRLLARQLMVYDTPSIDLTRQGNWLDEQDGEGNIIEHTDQITLFADIVLSLQTVSKTFQNLTFNLPNDLQVFPDGVYSKDWSDVINLIDSAISTINGTDVGNHLLNVSNVGYVWTFTLSRKTIGGTNLASDVVTLDLSDINNRLTSLESRITTIENTDVGNHLTGGGSFSSSSPSQTITLTRKLINGTSQTSDNVIVDATDIYNQLDVLNNITTGLDQASMLVNLTNNTQALQLYSNGTSTDISLNWTVPNGTQFQGMGFIQLEMNDTGQYVPCVIGGSDIKIVTSVSTNGDPIAGMFQMNISGNTFTFTNARNITPATFPNSGLQEEPSSIEIFNVYGFVKVTS